MCVRGEGGRGGEREREKKREKERECVMKINDYNVHIKICLSMFTAATFMVPEKNNPSICQLMTDKRDLFI